MKSIFETKEQYLQFKAVWKQAANTKKLTAFHFAFYCAVMGKDPFKAFTPVTNLNKLKNNCGNFSYFNVADVYYSVVSMAKLATQEKVSHTFTRNIQPLFGDIITVEMVASLLPRLEETFNDMMKLHPYYNKGLVI
jgi:hypothetical protein